MDKKDSSDNEAEEKASTIPRFVLKRIFPKDCARIRDEGGFIITLVNKIEPFLFSAPPIKAYIDKISVKLDGRKLDPEKFFIRHKGVEAPYVDLTELEGGKVNLNEELAIIYKGEEEIEPTTHVLDILIESPEPIRVKMKTKFRKHFF